MYLFIFNLVYCANKWRTFGEGWCSATRCLRPTTAHSSGCAAALYFEATPIQFQTGWLVGEWRTAKRPANGTPLFSGGLFFSFCSANPDPSPSSLFSLDRESARASFPFSTTTKHPIFQTHVRLVVYHSRGPATSCCCYCVVFRTFCYSQIEEGLLHACRLLL